MSSIIEQTDIKCSVQDAWDAIRDVGALDRKVAPGLVTSVVMESDDVRIVEFANGMQLREPIISIDDEGRRLCWTAQGEDWDHHNASLQIVANQDGSARAIWVADVLPHSAADIIQPIMKHGLQAMKHKLESDG